MTRMSEVEKKPEIIAPALDTVFHFCTFAGDYVTGKYGLATIESELAGPLIEKFGGNGILFKEVVSRALRAALLEAGPDGSEEHY